MKRVISASRRTDLIAFFPDEFSKMLDEGKTAVFGPAGRTYTVDLSPEKVHTIVLWSKNFEHIIANRFRLRERLAIYDQLYLHFTITGLGGTFVEPGVPLPQNALHQLDALLEILGRPERMTVRFDPLTFWLAGEKVEANLHFFEKLAPALACRGIKTVRFSFVQWYNKAKRRAVKLGFQYYDPPDEEKKKYTATLVQIAQVWGVSLFSCSQNVLTEVPGISPSACIDGKLLQRLHPRKEEASGKKDKSQRAECGCTESVDIGSYVQSCPHCCLYCYANPKV